MKKHSFNQAEVLCLGQSPIEKNIAWGKFSDICKTLGIIINVTGGNDLTHCVFGADEDDFNTLLCMVKEAYQ